jgi:hypothetical protein
VWPYLLRELELPDSAKPVLKTSLYSAIYGMPVPQVKAAISKKLGREVTARYFKLPLMSQLVEGRECRLQQMQEQGFMLDAFGKRHSVKVEKEAKKQAKALRTLLSHEIGSYEVRVMTAATRVIEESEGAARLVLWLHDGIYVKFRDSKRANLWKSRIREAVEEEAQKLNLPLRFVDE